MQPQSPDSMSNNMRAMVIFIAWVAGAIGTFGIAIAGGNPAWVLALPVGAMAELDFIWLVADTLNALMAIPNLIALLLLSPVVFKLTRDYFAKNVA